VKTMIKQDQEAVANTSEENRPYWCPERPYLLIRTRFIDDVIAEALRRSPLEKPTVDHHWQVVILGAGMDSRAFRLPWPAFTTAFEIDRVDVTQFKQSLVATFPPCGVTSHYLSADLSVEGACTSALTSAGFLVTCPTIWIIEGLLYYLSSPNVDALLAEVARLSSRGSSVIADVVNEAERAAVSFRSSVDYPEHFFRRFGFEPRVVLQPGEEGANYSRFLRPFPSRTLPLVASQETDSVRRSFLVDAQFS